MPTEKTITFRLHSSKPADGSVYITGNHKLLGSWQPDKVPLIKETTGCWQISFTFTEKEELAFKFTRGSWETEEVDSEGVVMGNRYVRVRNEKTIDLRIAKWRDEVDEEENRVVGDVRYHKDFKSKVLKENRTIVVWVPPGYGETKSCHFPVLYVHDGQNVFDPKTAFAGVAWRVDKTALRLIQEGAIEEIIVVGVYNTPKRLQEYADTKIGRNYMHFLVNELKPFIDQTYRTKPGRENTAIMGSSMGGLISLYLLWRYPDVFSKVACLSSSLFWKKNDIIEKIARTENPPQNIRLYVDHGGRGEEGKLTGTFRELKKVLSKIGYKNKVDFLAYFDRKGDHAERSWAKRVWRPLVFLFGK